MEKSPLTRRIMTRSPLVRRQEEKQRQEEKKRYMEENNISDNPLIHQLNDEFSNLPEINNAINNQRLDSGIRRSPSQPIRSQEEYNEYIERLAKQKALLKRFNKINEINKIQNNDQPLDHKEYRIRWKEGGKSRRKTHKRKQSRKIKKRNTRKNKRKNKRKSVKR